MSTSASAAPGPSSDLPPADQPPGPPPGSGGPPPAPPAPPAPSASGTAFWDWLLSLRVPRSEDRWLGGVCGGLAARTGVDPLLLRVGVVVLALLGGAGVALYAVAWLLLPDRSGRIEARALLAGEASGAATAALVLFVLAVVVPGPGTWWTGGPLVSGDDLVGALVLGALALVLVVWLPRWLGGARPGPRRAGGEGSGGATVATCRPSRRAPAGVGAGLTGLALLVGAGTWLLLLRAGEVPSWQGELPAWLAGVSGQEAVAVSAAAATAVFGLGLVVLGLFGRDDGTAGFLGTCTALLAVSAAVVPASAEVAVFGDEPWRPTTAAAAERGFAQFAGESVLDLRDLDPAPGATVEVPVRSGFGVVRVLAPDGVGVSLRGRLLAGSAGSDLGGGAGDGEDGLLVDKTVQAPAPGGRSDIVVDVQGLFGQVLLEGGAR